ncbi:MAG: sinR 3 [Armatimonadetes bacterium]|nr:sinR 3 [Armatimonadota bacterium]
MEESLNPPPLLPAETASTTRQDAEAVGRALCARVRELRKKRGWTLEELSAACGVSRSMLSEIERERANPTLVVAFRIAEAFGMSLGELVELPGGRQRIEVIRAGDRSYHYRSDADCRIRTLSPLHLEKSVEFYEIGLREGGALRSLAHFAGTRELVTVRQGSLRVTSGDVTEELSPGDSASYPADVPHALDNTGADEAVVYLVVTYPVD